MDGIEFVIVFWWIGRQEEEGKGEEGWKKRRERIIHVLASLSKPIMGTSQREASAEEKEEKDLN